MTGRDRAFSFHQIDILHLMLSVVDRIEVELDVFSNSERAPHSFD